MAFPLADVRFTNRSDRYHSRPSRNDPEHSWGPHGGEARAGKDRLLGFGSGTFRGGNGTDTIRFNAGSYAISAEGKGFLITANSIAMHVSSFEKIGSAFGAEQLVTLLDGILTIDGEGTAKHA